MKERRGRETQSEGVTRRREHLYCAVIPILTAPTRHKLAWHDVLALLIVPLFSNFPRSNNDMLSLENTDG